MIQAFRTICVVALLAFPDVGFAQDATTAPHKSLDDIIKNTGQQYNADGPLTVLNERRDDTGRHFTCDANLNVPLSNLRESTDVVARASILMGRSPSSFGIHYAVSIPPDSANFTVVLTPTSDEESNAFRILGDAVKAIQTDGPSQNNVDGSSEDQH